MDFEIRKYYRHATGQELAILCEVQTTMWGRTFVAEVAGRGFGPGLMPISGDTSSSSWVEISREEWMRNFHDEKKVLYDSSVSKGTPATLASIPAYSVKT